MQVCVEPHTSTHMMLPAAAAWLPADIHRHLAAAVPRMRQSLLLLCFAAGGEGYG